MKKRLVSILLITAMTTGLAACGSGSAKNLSADTPENTEASATVNTEASSEAPAAISTEVSTEVNSETTYLPDTEATDEADIIEQTGTYVGQYGYTDDGYSILSYTLDGKSVSDCGDFYLVDAILLKPVEVPELKDGEEYTFVSDELTGETVTIKCTGNNTFICEETNQDYYRPDDGNGWLYCDSADRVDAPFFKGRLRILKDAKTGSVLDDNIATITPELFEKEDLWFNQVEFTGKGFVCSLIFCGD